MDGKQIKTLLVALNGRPAAKMIIRKKSDMAEQFITCPKCNERIKLTDAIKHPIEESLRREMYSFMEYTRRR